MKKALKIVLGIVIVFVLLECGYRLYEYEQFSSNLEENTRYNFSSFRYPMYKLDVQTGYAYLPNLQNHQWLYDQDNNLLEHSSNAITNNFGMISSESVTVEKSTDEYRIVVLGDSFCATTTSNVTWPAALEGVLNKDENLKRQTGKKIFKVLNFGLDGTGIVQWPDVYKYKAAKFDPDLVVVNFIWDDIFREYIYRTTIEVAPGDYGMFTCTSLPAALFNRDCQNGLAFVIDPTKEKYKLRAKQIKDAIYRALVHHLPWFSPEPELLASLLGGRLGLKPALEIPRPANPHYATAEEAVSTSAKALEQIESMHPRLVILFHPTVEDCLSGRLPAVVTQLMAQAHGLKIINMLDYLRQNASKQEIDTWYNLPYDAHPSDYGAQIYAQAAEKQIAAAITAK